ncbi:MAG: hypothetical protein JWQ98_3192 [Chlorobi bacterium]|nr:hypothetical protein [Chlorobiota bacterium]
MNNSRDRSIADILGELSVEQMPERLVIFDQSAHLDWNRINWFSTNVDEHYPSDRAGYFNRDGDQSPQPSDTILAAAARLLRNSAHAFYSICETGFLQAFSESHPDQFASLIASGRLRIVGGGIVSPDSLLSHGECFIRNYLLGDGWLREQGISWGRHAWLPDSFGHDAQLPVMLDAMGIRGVGMGRIPGDGRHGDTSNAPDSAAAMLTADGADFLWRGNDGSEILTHWMRGGYDQAKDIDLGSPPDNIDAYVATNAPSSLTPFIHIPVSGQFAMPNERLAGHIGEWNETRDPRDRLCGVAGTFQHYAELVALHAGALARRGFHGDPSGDVLRFRPAPYWMGFYASRPALKQLHARATVAMLGAETYGYIADHLLHSRPERVRQRNAAIQDGWVELVPSTHHDYITGTASDFVYNGEYLGERGEQLIRLQNALGIGLDLRGSAVDEITARIGAVERGVAVFNQLGFERTGVVEVMGDDGVPILLRAAAPALGYRVHRLPTDRNAPGDVRVVEGDGGNIIIENGFLTATIDAAGGLVSLLDRNNGAAEMLAGHANMIDIFSDDGNLHRFGYELDYLTHGNAFRKDEPGVTVVERARIVEGGPLRCRIEATVSIESDAASALYRFVYILIAGEPFLRMETTGRATAGSTVMVRFPLRGEIDRTEHGTPYHWDHRTPGCFGNQPGFDGVFEATHDFMIARSNGIALGAIYHAGVPAWCASGNQLIGVLLRNTPGAGPEAGSATGSDSGEHTLTYAIRVPSGIESPETGVQLREARGYAVPLEGRMAGPAPAGDLPEEFSLSSVSSPGIITAAKTGRSRDLLLRVYQPTNATPELTLTMGCAATSARFLTALESPLAADRAAAIQPRFGDGMLDFTATRALTTIALRHEP